MTYILTVITAFWLCAKIFFCDIKALFTLIYSHKGDGGGGGEKGYEGERGGRTEERGKGMKEGSVAPTLRGKVRLLRRTAPVHVKRSSINVLCERLARYRSHQIRLD